MKPRNVLNVEVQIMSIIVDILQKPAQLLEVLLVQWEDTRASRVELPEELRLELLYVQQFRLLEQQLELR